MSKLKSFQLLILICLIYSCSGEQSANEQTLERLSQKELQYYTNGRQLYTKYCQNCHMEKGEGMGRLIPPLAQADYLLNDLAGAARIIKYGQKGPIIVNGIEYNQPMPANPQVTNVEIQMLLSYIGNAWGNETKVVSLSEIEKVLKDKP